MDPVSLILVVLVLFVAWKIFHKNEKAATIDRLPGPRAYPFIGNLLEILVPREKFMAKVVERRRTYGPIFRTWLGSLPAVHISTPKNIETILSSNKHTKKGTLYKFLYPWLGRGLLTSDGQKWFTHRKMITPTFHFKILDSFVDVYAENSDILVQKLQPKAESGEVFDVYPFITLCALDIICETAMGTKVYAQNDDSSTYVNSIYSISTITVQRGIKLWLHPDLIFYRTHYGKEYKKHLKILHGFTERVIKERKQLRQNRRASTPDVDNDIGTKKRQAFLDLLLEASGKDQTSKLTDVELREEVDTFMFEGHDTTTAGVCWALLLLGHNPKIQEEAYEELCKIFEDDPTRAVTMRDLGEMKLLERILKESLRLYPSVPLISRLLEEEITLGEHKVPSGTTVVLHIFNMHRDPDIFPNPDVFDPDRFLPENIQSRHPYAYVPFSAGPRNCIGQKFALLEEKTILSTLLRSYKFESVEKRDDLTLISELILRPDSGIKLKISKRT